METSGDREIQLLESKTEAIIEWLGLSGVATAAELDPSGRFGLKNAFRKYNGVYADPLPQNVIDEAKKKVLGDKTNEELIKIPLLEQISLHEETVPLFREQVFSAAQYIAKLGFELPLPGGTEGEGFVMVDHSVRRQPRVITGFGVILEAYGTKDPNIIIDIRRSSNVGNPATSIGLRIQK
jgi:hypothetical protein